MLRKPRRGPCRAHFRAFTKDVWLEKPGRPGRTAECVVACSRYASYVALLDLELLDGDDPFEVDLQAAHLFKHPHLGLADVLEVWAADPLFYPARPPAHRLMVAEVSGTVLVVPIAPSRSGDPRRCRPIGCYQASELLARSYREDR